MGDDSAFPPEGPPDSTVLGAEGRQLWRSLRNRNYRQYLLGQGLSNTGAWLQQTAELWLILQLTGSGTAVGVHSVLRFGPVLLLGAHGGLLSDRWDRRRLLIATQLTFAIGALVIAAAAMQGRPSLWLVYTVVLVQGLIIAVDNPLRRAFVRDLVSDTDLSNAVSLHSSVATLTRAIGPAIAGVLIARLGVAWCFLINAISYGAVLVVLLTLDRTRLRPQHRSQRAPRQVRDGVAYAWAQPAIRNALLLSLAAGVFAWNWTVLIPFYATDEFGGDAALYGILLSILSCGSVAGALIMARLTIVRRRHLHLAGASLAIALLLVAIAPTLLTASFGLVALGMTSTALIVGAQARIQLRVSDVMSGRVLALFTVVFVGSKPFAGLIGGWVTDLADSRLAFGIGAAVMASVVTVLWLRGRPATDARAA